MKDVSVRHAKHVKQAAGDQARAADARAAVDGDSFALNDFGVQLREQGKELDPRRWGTSVWDRERAKCDAMFSA